MEALSEQTLRSTVAMTAARGRGKSAALGLAIAAAVAFGYSNIFVTSPSPENLKTVFEFVFRGFDLLSYVEHQVSILSFTRRCISIQEEGVSTLEEGGVSILMVMSV